MGKVSTRLSHEIAKKTLLPSGIFIVILLFSISYDAKIAQYVDPILSKTIKKHILTLFIISAAFIVQRLIGAIALWYHVNVAAKTHTRLDDDFIPIFRRFLTVALWVVAFHTILPVYGINVNALIATLGVTSLAIALAAQDTIANIIAGFLIMVDKPFRLNDRIKLPSGELVKVLDIGIRRSRFLADDGSIVIVPNSDMSKSKIINYTYGEEFKSKG